MSYPSSSKPKSKTNQTPTTASIPLQRLPAPSLFVGPPSRNASNLSLARPPPPQSTTAKSSQSPKSPDLASTDTSPSIYNRQRANTASSTGSSVAPIAVPGPDLFTSRNGGANGLKPRPSKSKINAQWSSLQHTLADVELSAAGTQTHVFGSSHAEALRDLREAQVKLARAWGGGPGSEDSPEAAAQRDAGSVQGQEQAKDGKSRADKQGKGADAENEEGRGGKDLSNAAARREANEKYFAQVKQRVQDVVGKLDKVSDAMRRVEMESRDVWGEGESMTSAVSDENGGAAG